MSMYISQEKRQAVFARDNYTCQYCGCCDDYVQLEIDHIIPVSRGGTNDMGNLITACRICNNAKGKKILCDEKLKELADKINSSLDFLLGLIDTAEIRKVNIYLTPEEMKGLKALADIDGITITECITGLVKTYIANNEEAINLFLSVRDKVKRNVAIQ